MQANDDFLGQYQELARLASGRRTEGEVSGLMNRQESLRRMSTKNLTTSPGVAEALYAVRRLCPSLAVLAIPWMHPKLPIHPVQDEIMRTLAGEGRGCGTVTGRARRATNRLWAAGRPLLWFSRCALHAARQSLKLAGLHWKLRHEIGSIKRQRFDLIAKTWCFGTDRSADDRDFYYGDLQRRLAERGVRMLLLCGDAGSANWRAFARANISTTNLCRLPELCLISLLAPIWMALKQVLASLRLRRIAAVEPDPLVKRVCGLASRDCLAAGTASHGLFFWIGRTAVKTWHPRVFMILYEGYGWEKCAWWGAKVADESCRTVGYQHTVLFRQNISLLRPDLDSHKHSVPDVVLCIGERTKCMMQPGHPPRLSHPITFGSFRRNPDGEVHAAPRPGKRTVLVLPEGMLGEAKLLFDCAMRVSRSLPDHHFIFRCHPVLPFARVRPHLKGVPEEFPNIEISDRALIDDDFARSSVVLYRGSSSVLHAVLHGLKPIYLHSDHHHNVDPLFELVSWRDYVSSANEMELVLRRYAATTEDCASEEWRSAAMYVDGYTMPVDDASIDRFLAAVGLPIGKAVK